MGFQPKLVGNNKCWVRKRKISLVPRSSSYLFRVYEETVPFNSKESFSSTSHTSNLSYLIHTSINPSQLKVFLGIWKPFFHCPTVLCCHTVTLHPQRILWHFRIPYIQRRGSRIKKNLLFN